MRGRTAIRASTPTLLVRTVFLVPVAAMLVTSVIGGLLRAGVAVPLPTDGAWPGRAVLAHAFLMICAFMGTVIGLERAVALRQRIALAAPVASVLAGGFMLVGEPTGAAWLAVAASVVFILVNMAVVSRERAMHTMLLLTGATAWLIGNLLHALGSRPAAVIPWWLSFLVLTIAAERLEMTRLLRVRSGTAPALLVCLGTMLAGSAAFALSPVWGGWLFGLSLTGLSIWLVCFDVARHTVAARGLSRYMAVCLLLGYAWLAVSGLAWMAASAGYASRDAALHALGLGFVFSMMLGHAPVMLPALARVKVSFGRGFYAPLTLLHVSLAVRLLLGSFDFRMLTVGAACNAAAIALFAATLLGSALVWRTKHPPA